MFDGPFALALTAGMVATVNPCGFALLPAYLSAFVGLQEGGNRVTAVGRAVIVSLVLTAGFVTVFGLRGAHDEGAGVARPDIGSDGGISRLVNGRRTEVLAQVSRVADVFVVGAHG